MERRSWSRPETPQALGLAAGRAGERVPNRFALSLSPTTPHPHSVPGVCRITSSPSPGLAKPTNHLEEGRSGKTIITENIIKIIIHQSLGGSSNHCAPHILLRAPLSLHPLRLILPSSYLSSSLPLDLPAENCIVVALPWLFSAHQLPCLTTNQLFHHIVCEKRYRAGRENRR